MNDLSQHVNSEKILVSTAMLNAQFEVNKHDIMDSILPFVVYIIEKEYGKNKEISPVKISSSLEDQFGFVGFPKSAGKLLLNRLHKKDRYLSKENGKFYKRGDKSSELQQFETKLSSQKNSCNNVGNRLQQYLKNQTGKEVSLDEALESLFAFFEVHSLTISDNPNSLIMVSTEEKNQYEYDIAQFIIDQNDRDQDLFNQILDVLKGFYLSLAIYFQLTTGNQPSSYFENTKCYFDSLLILNLLGYKTHEDQEAIKQLVSMIKKNHGSICVFEHTCNEVYRILEAYCNSLKFPYKSSSIHTLEGLDIKNASPTDVENEMSLLRSNIQRKGLTIVDTPDHSENRLYEISWDKLSTFLKEHMSYSKQETLDTDIKSISAIALLRKNRPAKTLEKSGHIFITPNTELTKYSEIFFKKDLRGNIPYLYSEPMFSALLWLKSGPEYSNFPRMKLLQNAASSTEITPEIMEAFSKQIKLLTERGELTPEDAALLRTEQFAKKEVMIRTHGNIDRVVQKTVIDIKNDLKNNLIRNEKNEYKARESNYKKIIKRQTNQTNDAKRELNRIKNQKEETENREKEARRKMTEAENRIYDYIKSEGEKAYRKRKAILIPFAKITMALFLIAGTILNIIDYCSQSQFSFPGFILMLLSIAGLIDFCSSRFQYILKYIDHNANTAKRKKTESIRENMEKNSTEK